MESNGKQELFELVHLHKINFICTLLIIILLIEIEKMWALDGHTCREITNVFIAVKFMQYNFMIMQWTMVV